MTESAKRVGAGFQRAVVGRRFRWIPRADRRTFSLFARRIVTILDPKVDWEKVEVLVVMEEISGLVDSRTRKLVPPAPMMPPNTNIRLAGFAILRLNPSTNVLQIDFATHPQLVRFITRRLNAASIQRQRTAILQTEEELE